MWGCGQRGGTECTAGGSAVVRRVMRAERRPSQRWTDMHQKHWNAHKMLRLRTVTRRCMWRSKETAIYISLSRFATETILPELLPMFSSAWFPPFGLQVQDKTGRRWRLCVVDTISECTLSASPHTPWHLLQDGVNDLHEIYRRISAVRGAGEVRTHISFVIIRHYLCMKCHCVM